MKTSICPLLLALTLLASNLSAQTLVHLWAFDEPLGEAVNTFADSSGNGQTGDGVADVIPGKFGNAAKMYPASSPVTGGIGDGVDFVDATPEDSPLPIAATDSWSISMWASFGEAPGNLEYLAGFGIDDEENNGNQRRARSVINFNNTDGFHFWGASVDLATNIPMPADNQWHMYTITYDGASTQMNMYFDGKRVAKTTFGGSGPFVNAPAEVHVGNPSNWNQEFDGSIDEFGIWHGVLAPEQIGGLFQENDTTETQFLEPNAVVNRATGHIELKNLSLADVANVVGYRIKSTAGSLDFANWTTITGNLDSGQGVQPVDNGPWMLGSSTDFELSESDQGGTPGTLHLNQTIDLGAIWTKSRHEDIVVELLTSDGITPKTLDVLVFYAGQSHSRSDLNTNGSLDLNDWQILTTNSLTSLAGLSIVDASLRGDLDGDGDNDRQDFRLFRADYIDAHGAAAFASLSAVPEPSTASGMLVLVTIVAGLRRRR